MKTIERIVLKAYLKEVYYGDRNNAVVETYNEYRRSKTEDFENFEWLDDTEETFELILNDEEYLEWLFEEIPQEDYEEWLDNINN